MSAVELVPTLQSPGPPSLVSLGEPETEVPLTRHDVLAQPLPSVASRRMKLLVELGGFHVSDETFEMFLTQLAPKLRRLMTSDVILFVLWNSGNEQFQIKVFDTNGQFAYSPDFMGDVLWEHMLSTNKTWIGSVRHTGDDHMADRDRIAAPSVRCCALPLAIRRRILGSIGTRQA